MYGVVAVLALALALAGCGEAPDGPDLRLRVMTLNFKYASEQGEQKWSDRRIDLILVDPDYRVARTDVVTYQEQGRYPSDHFPVVCELELSPKD